MKNHEEVSYLYLNKYNRIAFNFMHRQKLDKLANPIETLKKKQTKKTTFNCSLSIAKIIKSIE